MALEQVGVRLVTENASPFNKALQAAEKRVADFTKQTTTAAKSSSPLSRAFEKLGISVEGLRDKLLGVVNASGPMGNALVQLAAALGPLTLAVAAATAAIVGFIALGMRGAALRGLAESFDALTRSVGVFSETLLQDLRRASAGTVSDFDLIRSANLALAGAVGQFGQQFAQALPRLLEIARAQARATGQDVNFLFESLVRGIKRSSPLLIDNTGLVLRVGEANQAYAESIGKTVEQLTAEERQIALLNATLEAGQSSIDQAATIQETAAEKLARAGATISNIFDKLALAVQPAFEAILDVINRVLSAIDQLLTAVLPAIQQGVSDLAAPFVAAGNAVMGFIQPIVDLASNTIPYVIAAFQILREAIGGVISFLWGLIEPLVRPIIEAFQRIGAFISNPDNVRALFVGGARMIGALASGIMAAANQFVFPAIISIARFIADFLMGLSPPPKGPLSTIDKGGANLMMAWLEGITGVSLDPVKQVAAEVAAALGAIGKLTREQVETRLLMLDRALQPFADRLAIVKAQFDALREPAEAALRAVDRQLEKAVQALAQGDAQAAASVRALDMQRAAIEGALEGQQAMVDQMQLQFALAKAQQAQERTLLEIRKRMLGPVQAITDKLKGKKKPGEKAPKEIKPKAGGAPTPAPAMGGGISGLPEGTPGTDVLDLIGGQGAIDDARAALEQGFLEGLDPMVVGEFGDNLGLLGSELKRIQSVDVGARIADRLSGMRQALDDALSEAFEGVRNFFTGTGEGTLNGIIQSGITWFQNLPTEISNALSNLGNTLNNSILTPLRNLFSGGGGLGGGIDTIPSLISGMITEFTTLPTRLVEALAELVPMLFTNPGAPFKFIGDWFGEQLEGNTSLWGIIQLGLAKFRELPTLISNELQGLWATIVDGPLQPFIRFFTGAAEDEYTLQWYLQQGVDFFGTLPDRISQVLSSMADVVWNAVVVPVIAALNGVISAVEQALRALVGAVIDLLDTLLGGIDSLIDTLGLNLQRSGDAPIIQQLRSLQGSLSLPRISTGRPAAAGGIFGQGLLRVGERGTEGILNAASKTAVFPSSVMRSMDALTGAITQMVAQPAPMPIPAGGDSYNTDNSMAVNFNGRGIDQQSMLRLRTLQAYRGRR